MMKLYRFTYENFRPKKSGKECWSIAKDLRITLFTDKGIFVVVLRAGFKWNGASVPMLFRWFIPNWDKKDERFNILSALHDASFATKGFFGLISYDECNDIYRGGLRNIGYNRLHASVAHWCVDKFAHNHFGQDEYKISSLCSMGCV